MQPYSQETIDAVLALVPHENHRKLVSMIGNGTSIEEIKEHGFDDIQVAQYTSLLDSVVSGETPIKRDVKVEEPAPTQPQAEPTPETTQPEPEPEPQPEPQPEETQPTTTEPVADTTEPTVETTTDTPAVLPTEETTVSEENAGEIPA